MYYVLQYKNTFCRPQDATQNGSISAILMHFGLMLAFLFPSIGHPRPPQHPHKNQSEIILPQDAFLPRSPQDGPQTCQDCPMSTQHKPKRPQDSPKRPWKLSATAPVLPMRGPDVFVQLDPLEVRELAQRQALKEFFHATPPTLPYKTSTCPALKKVVL